MRIELLYYPECPSHERALELIYEALALEGKQAEVQVIRIETEEQAIQHRFVGSPTIRIDGRELQPQPHLPYRLTCRAFLHEDGRIAPVPSLATLREAVRSAEGG
ncbi:MAG: thioredoxin family protein [Armatimonadota bacterium]|nr:thioredoxin family protein [Armatimonadota bacterium]MDW8107021.1 thioredoxin family protein [Armatimonadota bacterium]